LERGAGDPSTVVVAIPPLMTSSSLSRTVSTRGDAGGDEAGRDRSVTPGGRLGLAGMRSIEALRAIAEDFGDPDLCDPVRPACRDAVNARRIDAGDRREAVAPRAAEEPGPNP
jgi:hypothetical protein